MIKKLTAFGFILIANMVMLAHAVLPHHHHEQQVCIERKHCIDDATTHTHNSAEHNHQHDGTDNTACALKQAVIIPTQDKFLKSCDNCTDNHYHDFYILSTFEYVFSEPVSEVVRYIPEFYSFYITFVTPTIGLRAPPIV